MPRTRVRKSAFATATAWRGRNVIASKARRFSCRVSSPFGTPVNVIKDYFRNAAAGQRPQIVEVHYTGRSYCARIRSHLAIFLCSIVSARQPSPIDDEHVAMDIVAGGGTEKQRGSGNICRTAPTRRGNSLQDLPTTLRIVSKSLGVVGRHVAGRDGVDVDSFRGPLIGQRFCEKSHA